MPVVVTNSPNRIEMMKWSLVPFWERSANPKGLINIRDDTFKTKKWAHRYIETQRCLISATGFYEWQRTASGKIPYYIGVIGQSYFSFAGFYSSWKTAEGKEVNIYAIITTEPNEMMLPIHNRMPVILARPDEQTWLNPNTVEIEHLLPLLEPYPPDQMFAYPVSTRVNNPKNNDGDLTQQLRAFKPRDPDKESVSKMIKKILE
jgi:putative SOS response-associated peptidase YedK